MSRFSASGWTAQKASTTSLFITRILVVPPAGQGHKHSTLFPVWEQVIPSMFPIWEQVLSAHAPLWGPGNPTASLLESDGAERANAARKAAHTRHKSRVSALQACRRRHP